MNKYVDMFLGLKCSGDVLNAVGKMNDATKEITESIAIIQRLKQVVLAEPAKYDVIDMCAGNALTSIIAAFLLPIREAYAIDKQKRHGNYENVRRFTYWERDINDIAFDYSCDTFILIAVHPCKTANNIISIFNKHLNIKHLIMMPCCNAEWNDFTGAGWLHETKKVSAYDMWTLHLANNIKNANVKISTDNYVLSPKNNVIVASR